MIHVSLKVLILTFCFWLKTFLYPWGLFKNLGHIWGKPPPAHMMAFWFRGKLWSTKNISGHCLWKTLCHLLFFIQMISQWCSCPQPPTHELGAAWYRPEAWRKAHRCGLWMQMIETALLKGSSFANHCCPWQRAHSSALTLSVSFLCVPCSWQWGHWGITLFPSRDLNAMGGVHEAQSCSEISVWPLHTDIVQCSSIYSSKVLILKARCW